MTSTPTLIALPLERFRPRRYRPGNLGTWSGHLPFARDLVASLRPQLLVELGTHYGESYFGFCQAVQESAVACRCFAVDTWTGDEHAGFYGEDVYTEVERHNREFYEPFSTLLRETFDTAAERFERESVDLVHIDGLHTYEAVLHDFNTWFPKLKPGGVVLLHDIDVHRAGFEVWRLWEELSQAYPHFAFQHWWGLGVILKPGGGPLPPLLDILFGAQKSAAIEQIRTLYSEAAELLEFRERSPHAAQAAADDGRPYLQVFPSMPGSGFGERESLVFNIDDGVWNTYRAALPKGSPGGLIRLDPVNRVAWVEISQIRVSAEGETLIDLATPDRIAELYCARHLSLVPNTHSACFFAWGPDPQLFLPLAPDAAAKAPLSLEITLRVQFTLESARDLLVR